MIILSTYEISPPHTESSGNRGFRLITAEPFTDLAAFLCPVKDTEGEVLNKSR